MGFLYRVLLTGYRASISSQTIIKTWFALFQDQDDVQTYYNRHIVLRFTQCNGILNVQQLCARILCVTTDMFSVLSKVSNPYCSARRRHWISSLVSICKSSIKLYYKPTHYIWDEYTYKFITKSICICFRLYISVNQCVVNRIRSGSKFITTTHFKMRKNLQNGGTCRRMCWFSLVKSVYAFELQPRSTHRQHGDKYVISAVRFVSRLILPLFSEFPVHRSLGICASIFICQ